MPNAHTYTEFWKLKKIIVWNVQNYNLEKLDVTFKIAYWENLRYSNFESYKDYKVDKQKILERKEDLDNLAKLLESLNIEVYRPDELSNFKTFKTPYISWVLNAISNPRDLVLIYW
jgi:predicted transcriptional regulator